MFLIFMDTGQARTGIPKLFLLSGCITSGGPQIKNGESKLRTNATFTRCMQIASRTKYRSRLGGSSRQPSDVAI